jgi:hypothetical protein
MALCLFKFRIYLIQEDDQNMEPDLASRTEIPDVLFQAHSAVVLYQGTEIDQWILMKILSMVF